MRRRIVYFAPGSGLGHLNRALAVCLELRALGADPEIVTNSPFAEGLARLARLPITRIATELWEQAAPAYLISKASHLVVLDTFPFGMRGEWIRFAFTQPVIYMARRLAVGAYRDVLPEWPDCGRFQRIIACEQLSSEHDAAIAAGCVARLPGPVRLKPGLIPTSVPPALNRILDTPDACLVVHGGPVEEVSKLLTLSRGNIALLTPWTGERWPCPAFDYYPATNIFDRAAQVVSGAGYNMMADMLPFPERHTAVAFPRRFDDQAGRLAAPRPRIDGTREAATLIAELL